MSNTTDAERSVINPLDQFNQRTWNTPWVLTLYATLQGFIEVGESAAYRRIVDEVRDQPILDLGVGAGRTIALLRAVSTSYVAIDHTPAMVEAARRTYPFADVQLGDARDLSKFAAESFPLVAFSNRGIDCMGHDDRRQILAEVYRVLKPNGIFWFSTLNKDGESPRRRPWRTAWPRPGKEKLRYVADLYRTIKSIARETFNYAAGRRLQREGDGWLVAPFYAHDYHLVFYYTTLAYQIAELARTGFRGECEVFDNTTGNPVKLADDLSGIPSFHILARK